MATILNGKPESFLTVLAPVCSSFSGMNVAVHKRCALWPEGDETIPSVKLGNLLCSRSLACMFYMCLLCQSCRVMPTRIASVLATQPRCCLLLLLITAMNGAWMLEQPAGSYMGWYQDLVDSFQKIGEA